MRNAFRCTCAVKCCQICSSCYFALHLSFLWLPGCGRCPASGLGYDPPPCSACASCFNCFACCMLLHLLCYVVPFSTAELSVLMCASLRGMLHLPIRQCSCAPLGVDTALSLALPMRMRCCRAATSVARPDTSREMPRILPRRGRSYTRRGCTSRCRPSRGTAGGLSPPPCPSYPANL